MLRFIILAPLVGAAINWLVGRRVRSEAFIGAVASLSIAVSCALSLWLAFGTNGALVGEPHVILDHVWTWMEVGRFRADIGFAMDRLSGIYACFITFVGLLIHIFATGYMHGDKSFYRFFAYLNLFMFMMLTLVLADNLLLMFVGWEGVGLCSYLLIGYYIDRREAGDAAKKAFVANRVGDWGVVLGIMLVFSLTSSISFFDKTGIGVPVKSALASIAAMPVEPFAWGALVAGGITSAALLLFIGATGKSAQIPLFVWLPDAMAGPTPVSALIHAATMVTAGVYMIVRCSAIYTHAPTAMFIVAVVGAATALFAATIGIAQNDIKKVLAYSTVSQLGYMMLACGVGAFVAAIFHVMTHAFFKALLFLGSGSVIHGMHHEQDMRRMGGLKKYMPVTFATMLTGWLAISGIPIFAGFFSKDEILWKTWSTSATAIPAWAGKTLWVVGALTALLTAIYMTRLMVLTFWGSERFREAHAGGQADEAHAHAYDEGDKAHDAKQFSAGDRPHHQPASHVGDAHDHAHASVAAHDDEDDEDEHAHPHAPVTPHESPWTMTVPLVVLAILSTLGGLVGVPYALSGGAMNNYFEHTLEPVVERAPQRGGGHAEVGTGDASHLAATPGAPARSESHGAPAPAAESHATETPSHGNEGALPPSVDEGEHGGAPAPEHAHDPAEVRAERIFSGISVAIALAGIGIGWTVFRKNPLRVMPRLLENKYYVDEAYDAVVINPIKVGSREGLWKIFDVKVVDGLVNGLARATSGVGDIARRMQAGFVRGYAAIILLGALLVIGYFVFNFTRVLSQL
ncbi:MAG TPA: NADH-quinone oxidoreductase subunit L [Pyrinomonadaceae bacterium]|jgi:NADH-quinone oxidoreductase subunit L|nr:NADH-quinone oxidoreductase subunit L [Pyrinomonadaceae bacterium]